MKKTRKALLGVTALIIAFSACSLTACNSSEPEDDGTVKGNYTVVTDKAEMAQTLSAIDEEKLLGDTTAENYNFGLDLLVDLNASTDMAGFSSTSFDLDLGYKMLLSGTLQEPSYKGAGSFNVGVTTETKDPTDTTGEKTITQQSSVKLDAYQQDTMVYATLNTGKKAGQTEDNITKLKLDTAQLIGDVMPILPDISEGTQTPDITQGTGTTQGTSADQGTESSGTAQGTEGTDTTPSLPDGSLNAETQISLTSAITMLAEMGATVAMDTADGIKLKITVTKEMLIAALTEAQPEASEAITFKTCALDLYFVIDSTGLFRQASAVMDMEFALDTSKLPTPQATDFTLSFATDCKLSGKVIIKSSPDLKVELPENLDKDQTYVDGNEIILGLIGNIAGGNAK